MKINKISKRNIAKRQWERRRSRTKTRSRVRHQERTRPFKIQCHSITNNRISYVLIIFFFFFFFFIRLFFLRPSRFPSYYIISNVYLIFFLNWIIVVYKKKLLCLHMNTVNLLTEIADLQNFQNIFVYITVYIKKYK